MSKEDTVITKCEIKSKGLTTSEAKSLQLKYGKNELKSEKKENFFKKIFRIVCEPMFLLLIVAAIIYFILGEPRDAIIMLIFVISIICIDAIQQWKTDKTLNALKDLSSPHITVLRDGTQIQIASADIVPGDIMIIHEGVKIPADGVIVKCNDLCVDESSLTGEAEGIWKVSQEEKKEADDYWRKDYCYAGTLVIQGSGVICVNKIGANTEYGKIGIDVTESPEEKTLLEKNTQRLIKLCSYIAATLFLLVCIVTWFNIPELTFYDRLIQSIISGITLAMAMIPEEFPVVLTVFLSMGAWRLAKKHSLIRRLPCVETLGAVSVLCVDKTGTITMNQMTVEKTWAINDNEHQLCEIMGLACETNAYDPMEKAMLNYCDKKGISQKSLFDGELIDEYTFTNELKMMGHVWQKDNEVIIAAKGSPESILSICEFEKERIIINHKANEFSKEGLRVIAVATNKLENKSNIPKKITDCSLKFCGLICLNDPPRESIKNDISICNKAGIRVVMITGDNGITAASIAKKVGIKNYEEIVTGDMIEEMTDEELLEKIKTVNIFSRVIPKHKMRIVKAFKDNNKIVAMTGDGVNDAPALKYADIGIAMGKRGSEVSREAADLVLMDDNFSTIVDTVKDGRRIYDNIRKAIGYIFIIHVPIALTCLLAPILGIPPTDLMILPLHVVLLELIIDPTCSIVLERQPAETNIMERGPRNHKEELLNTRKVIRSVIQGLVIFTASFSTYYYTLLKNPDNAPLSRSLGLAVIMIANLFLVQVNSSEIDSFIVSIKRLIKDKVMWAITILTILGLLIILYTPLNEFLKFAPITAVQFAMVFGISVISVLWYEIVKFIKRVMLINKSKNKG